MTTFDERERAFETKFAHDAELRFKAQGRATNLLALWAAREMGRSGEDAVDYARSVLLDWLRPGSHDAVGRIIGDLAGVKPESAVRARYGELLAQARQQVIEEG